MAAVGEEKIAKNRIITDRFLDVMYHLIGKRVIRNKKEFAEAVGLASSNMYRLELEKSMNVPLYAIENAYHEFGANPIYIITGEGEMIINR